MDEKYLLGVMASEGCFNVSNTKVDSCKFGIQVRFMFDVGVLHRDSELIETLRDTVGVGEVRKQKELTRWTVRRHDDIDELIEFIEEYKDCGFQYCSKHDAYEKWRDLWSERSELMETKEGMKELTKRGININPNDARRGRDVDEVHEIIEENA